AARRPWHLRHPLLQSAGRSELLRPRHHRHRGGARRTPRPGRAPAAHPRRPSAGHRRRCERRDAGQRRTAGDAAGRRRPRRDPVRAALASRGPGSGAAAGTGLCRCVAPGDRRGHACTPGAPGLRLRCLARHPSRTRLDHGGPGLARRPGPLPRPQSLPHRRRGRGSRDRRRRRRVRRLPGRAGRVAREPQFQHPPRRGHGAAEPAPRGRAGRPATGRPRGRQRGEVAARLRHASPMGVHPSATPPEPTPARRLLAIAAGTVLTLVALVGSGLLLNERLAPKATGAPGHALPLQATQTEIDRELAPLLAANPGKTGALLLPDGLDAYAARAMTAQKAGRSLDLQYYIWHDDLTGHLLVREVHAAAERGVRVRILLDDMNAAGRDPQWMALDAHPNIELRLYNPFRNRSGIERGLELVQRVFSVNHRMHNKAWIADGRVAIIGGRNIGEKYFAAAGTVNFRDLD